MLTIQDDLHFTKKFMTHPRSSDLLILPRGLGLRTNLTKFYDSPQNLVLLANATPEEEVVINEELGIIGC